ncbi:MAG TPA: DUF4136 domain-containing protein [Chryseolinea sp.]
MYTYRTSGFWAICGFLSLLWSCQPEPDSLRLLDELVVSTSYDSNVDFQTYSTYSIATDTIGFVSNQANDTILVQTETDYPRPVLQKVINNLNAVGYSRVAPGDNPDMRINVYVVNDFNLFQQVIYPDYYYPSYYGYGYGYGSYYAYPYVNTYATNTGSLVVEILDLKNVTPDNKVKVIWGAYMGDVYSTIDLIKQSENAIDQAFVQSPYLHE